MPTKLKIAKRSQTRSVVLNQMKLRTARKLSKPVTKNGRQRKTVWGSYAPWISAGSVTILLNLSLLSGWYLMYKKTVLAFTASPQISANLELRGSLPQRIIIPSLELDQSIVPAAIQNGIWQTSQTNPNYLLSSARPNEGSNIVIYGHNTQAIFGKLRLVQLGQSVTLTTQQGKQIEYEIVEKKVVKPTEVEIIAPTTYEVLTIYTCTGPFDSQRLVIKAIPKKIGG